jgi:hypothetical protein
MSSARDKPQAVEDMAITPTQTRRRIFRVHRLSINKYPGPKPCVVPETLYLGEMGTKGKQCLVLRAEAPNRVDETNILMYSDR